MHNYHKKCFAKDTSLTAQQVIDELMLVHLDQDQLALGRIYVMNEIAGHIWGLLDSQRCFEDILRSILDEFDVTPERAESDLVAFLGQLEQVGVVWTS